MCGVLPIFRMELTKHTERADWPREKLLVSQPYLNGIRANLNGMVY